jgi:hypothetical protein
VNKKGFWPGMFLEKEESRMILIACVDDEMGMRFNHRRVSRDQAVMRDIVDQCQGAPLYLTSETARLLGNIECPNVQVSELLKTEKHVGQYVWIEEPELIEETFVEQIILYHWNRRYPSDAAFPIELKDWQLTSRVDFAGNSHENITKETYIRKE